MQRVLWKEKFQSCMHVRKRGWKISPRVMILIVSQYVIGFTCHNESMLIGLFRQRQFADERKWLFVSADVRGAGTRDEPLRTSAWEATSYSDFVLSYNVGHFWAHANYPPPLVLISCTQISTILCKNTNIDNICRLAWFPSWNRTFSLWRHFTRTTRILLVFLFSC